MVQDKEQKKERTGDYEWDRQRETVTILQFISAYISWIFLIFWAVDWVYNRDLVWRFLGIRIVAVCIAVVLAKMAKSSRSASAAEGWALAVITCYAWAITILIVGSDGAKSPYFAGLNLICLAGLCFMPFRTVSFGFTLAAIYLPVLIFSVFDCWANPDKISPFIINLAFAAAMSLVAVLIAFFRSGLRRAEFEHRRDLAVEIKNRAAIIEQKTQELVQLKELSRQFSPQIVAAIQANTITILTEGAATPICALFVDIVGSTERILSIGGPDFNTVITKFLGDTMRILVRHDLTIDKFLGDGILAFSGAPLATADYIERALAAAEDIIRAVHNEREVYAAAWQTEFKIRIGLAAGVANVGFYGDAAILRCYTAIGGSINLAARLCSEAAPGQVLVSAEVAAQAASGRTFAPVLTPLKLKGFESVDVEAFLFQIDLNQLNQPNQPNQAGLSPPALPSAA